MVMSMRVAAAWAGFGDSDRNFWVGVQHLENRYDPRLMLPLPLTAIDSVAGSADVHAPQFAVMCEVFCA